MKFNNLASLQSAVESVIKLNVEDALQFEILGEKNTTSIPDQDIDPDVLRDPSGARLKIEIAKKEIRKHNLKKYLCPVLQQFSGDVMEIMKTITPILFAISSAKVIELPFNHLIYAGIAILISRSGIASFCCENK